MRIKSYIPITADLGEAEPAKMSVKRLTLSELTELRARYKAVLNSKPDDDESRDWKALLDETFSKYLRLEEPITVETAAGDVDVKVDQLCEYFAAQHPGKLMDLFVDIMNQSSLDDKKKSTSPSPTDSKPSLPELNPEAPGQKQETTAEHAERKDSAPEEDATSPLKLPSGSTDQATQKQEGLSMLGTHVPSFP